MNNRTMTGHHTVTHTIIRLIFANCNAC